MIISLTVSSVSTLFIIFYMILSYVIMDLSVFDKRISDEFSEKYLLIFG